MSASLDSVAYCMSVSQLDELWHYDLWLGHVLMDLPLRTCTAKPANHSKFPAMGSVEFQTLKEEIRKMWIFASQNFTCGTSDKGVGLFFGPDIEQNGKLLTPSNPGIMGWLARAPSVEQCPTGHRYLRSMCRKGEEDNIYLGGPISLANYDEVNRVDCKRCISTSGPRKNKLSVTRSRGRRLLCGMEVLWSYNLDTTTPNLSPKSEWQLVTCCNEVEKLASVSSLPEIENPAGLEKQKVGGGKKRRVGGQMPRKKQSLVESIKPCTYCGINVPSHIKRHWALTHAKDLCKEMAVQADDVNNPVSPKHFMQHLDKVDHVYNSLNNHNYKVIPACNFFKIMGIPLLELNASCEEKDRMFKNFLAEGRSAFKKYNVLYLKGISVPKSYEDLLMPDKSTNYSTVNWDDSPPSTNNFSLVSFQLSETEDQDHAEDIQNSLTNAVLGWMSG